jgi:hypothetical protein
MPKSASVIPKPNKGGRPATGRDPVRAIRLSDAFMASVEHWAMKQTDQPGRSAAIRRLVEIGLSHSKQSTDAKVPSKESAARAAELAAKVIEKKLPVDTSPDEKAVRKRKLLQGPSAFRDSRKDRAAR